MIPAATNENIHTRRKPKRNDKQRKNRCFAKFVSIFRKSNIWLLCIDNWLVIVMNVFYIYIYIYIYIKVYSSVGQINGSDTGSLFYYPIIIVDHKWKPLLLFFKLKKRLTLHLYDYIFIYFLEEVSSCNLLSSWP